MNTIVIGYDDTEPAKRALQRAADLAARFDARVIVTSVAPILVGGRGVGAAAPRPPPPEEHRRELRNAAAVLGERGVDAEYDLALDEPARHIVKLAEERGADLIVVGSTEPNLLERLLGMSVSDKVERTSRCDVLIVH